MPASQAQTSPPRRGDCSPFGGSTVPLFRGKGGRAMDIAFIIIAVLVVFGYVMYRLGLQSKVL
jgi:hypothetical protein